MITRRGVAFGFLGCACCGGATGGLTSEAFADSGRMLQVNGRLLPSDMVFRFLPITLPLTDVHVTQLYGIGKDPIGGYRAFHPGIDFGCHVGTPVLGTAAGEVSYAGWMHGYGNLVEVRHGLGFSTRYAHLSEIGVGVGSVIDRNTLVGKSGDSGRVNGPHLHFEIRREDVPTDPAAFLIRANELYRSLS